VATPPLTRRPCRGSVRARALGTEPVGSAPCLALALATHTRALAKLCLASPSSRPFCPAPPRSAPPRPSPWPCARARLVLPPPRQTSPLTMPTRCRLVFACSPTPSLSGFPEHRACRGCAAASALLCARARACCVPRFANPAVASPAPRVTVAASPLVRAHAVFRAHAHTHKNTVTPDRPGHTRSCSL